MAISRPYFNLHQITTGLYAKPGLFTDEIGNDYEGLYHILPTGQYFSGELPTERTFELFEKDLSYTQDVIKFNRINNLGISKYISPVFVQTKITDLDIQRGVVDRYFVQKRSSPRNTIIEIDVDQYNSMNNKNYPGINSIIWNGVIIEWVIHLRDKQKIIELNSNTLTQKDILFPGIKKYLSNLLEYSI